MTNHFSSHHRQHEIGVRSMTIVALFVGTIILPGCLPAGVETPETFSQWNSRDGSFALDYPEGWTKNGGGSRSSGLAWAEFSKGSYNVRIDANFADSMKAEAFGSGGGVGAGLLGGNDEDIIIEVQTPEGAVQAFWKSSYEEKYTEYVEEPAESFRTKLGPTIMNKFSAKSGFAKIKGIRATTLSNDRSVTFFATCPEKKWEAFGPIYEEMLRGLKLGKEEM